MTLRDLLNGVNVKNVPPGSQEIKAISCVSGECVKGTLFVAIKGEHRDGNDFIQDALKRGCCVVVSEHPYPDTPDCKFVQVSDAHEALSIISGNLYNHPGDTLLVCGITGTSGKTTTSYLADAILRGKNGCSTIIGTIRHTICGRSVASNNTTPESYTINAYLREAIDKGSKHAVMEVSSHALKLKRVHGICFSIAVFTNLTRDHMDFHQDERDYLNSKVLLFSSHLKKDGIGIINIDDPKAAVFEEKCRGSVLKYSMNRKGADIHPERVEYRQNGMSIMLNTPSGKIRIETHLKGPFNVYNIMAAVGVGLGAGISSEIISHGIESIKNVDGRFESVEEGQPFNVIVDYAHKPDALEKVLSAARKITKTRLISVFGCGGDRDRGKRPIMGNISEKLADFTYITSDNPRSEEPDSIINEIRSGMKDESRYSVIVDRADAIRTAISSAKPGDTVVIAGKGHEDYQIIGTAKIHFDDREQARNILKGLYGTANKQN